MNARDAARLLGGYATGTLTEEERAALFTAALDDQQLFDALADEEAVRDLLADPVARARLAAALEAPRPGFAAWWRRPAWSVVAATAAVAVMAVALVRMGSPPVNKAVVAELRQAPALQASPPPAPARREDAPARPPQARLKVAGGHGLAQPVPAARSLDVGATTAKKAAGVVNVAPPPPLAPQTLAMADQAMPMAAMEPAQKAEKAPARVRRENEMKVRSMAAAPPAGLARAGFMAQAAPLRWRLLGSGIANVSAASPPRATVATGEPFGIEVTPAARGWVYILEPDGAGGWKQAAGGEASPEKPLRFPMSGTLEFGEPGTKVWRAVYSSAPASVPPSVGALTIQIEVVRR